MKAFRSSAFPCTTSLARETRAALARILFAAGIFSLSAPATAQDTAPVITTQPINQTATVGYTAIFTVAATGNPSPAYQWQSSPDGDTWTDIMGNATATTAMLRVFGVITDMDGTSYRCVASNSEGSATSDAAMLTAVNIGGGQDAMVVAMAAGMLHSLYVKHDGSLWAMGNNNSGQFGDGTTDSRYTPAQVDTDIIAVATGGSYVSLPHGHSLRVKRDGSLWAAGRNDYGQLGDGTNTDRNTPVQVDTDVIAVAANEIHSLYVKGDGSLWAMGHNEDGKLGNGTNSFYQNTPVQVAADVITVAAGGSHSLFVKRDGSLWAMGDNGFGQLGNGTNIWENTPVQVATDVSAVAAGYYHSLFVKNDGTLWVMGANASGQLGNGTNTARNTPVQVATGVTAVAAGGSYSYDGTGHSLFVKNDGTLWAMGDNYSGQLGNGTTTNRNTPVQVATDAIDVAAGTSHNLFVKSDGSLWVMGANLYGQLGLGDADNRLSPALIPTTGLAIILTHPVSRTVHAGKNMIFTIATTGVPPPPYQWQSSTDGISWMDIANDTLYSGANTFMLKITAVPATLNGMQYRCIFDNGEAILNSTPATLTVTPAPPDSATITAAATGGSHSLYVTGDGKLYGMGRNYHGQLGDGTSIDRSSPRLVASATNTVAVAAGGGHSLYVTGDGKLYGMGRNYSGQLGGGATTNRPTPQQVTSASNVIAVSAGDDHSLYLTGEGNLWGMGANNYGQLGISDTTNQLSPVLVATDVIAMSAGSYHSFYLASDGKLYGMGRNDYGQLGDCTITSRTSPVLIATDVTAMSAGGGQSLFVTRDGKLWAMGYNANGELGDGTVTNRSTPVRIAANVVEVSAGVQYLTGDGTLWRTGDTQGARYPVPIFTSDAGISLGGSQLWMTGDNKLWAIGSNSLGQLGVGDNAERNSPTLVLDLSNPANIAPAVITHPISQMSAAGRSVTFISEATGIPEPTYQWYLCKSAFQWEPLSNDSLYSGVTTGTLTLISVIDNFTTYMHGYRYRCVVKNPVCAAESDPATLTIGAVPRFTTQPANRTVTLGQNTTFTIVVTGTPTPTRQWQSSADNTTWVNLSNTAPYSGATTGTLAITTVPASLNGMRYRCVATNTITATNSTAATLTVNTPPAIGTQPGDQTINAGQNTTFTVAAAGTPAPTYQWQFLADSTTWTNLSNTAPYSGVTTDTLTITNAPVTLNGMQYRCFVTNSQGNLPSAPATLTVNPTLAITTHPASLTILPSQNATFTIEATGDPAPACQWQILGSDSLWASLVNNTTYSGVTTASLTIANVTASMSGAQYRCIVSNTVGDIPSNPATLTVATGPIITTHPANTTAAPGNNATFTIVATGTPAPAYQWQILGTDSLWAPLSDTSPYSGVTTPALTITAVTTTMSGAQYRCAVSNMAGDILSTLATLTVATAPVAPAIAWAAGSGSQTVQEGSSATFAVNLAAGTSPLSYAWWKNNTLIAGATTATHTTPAVTLADNGATFKVEVANSAGTASLTATLTVTPDAATAAAQQLKTQLESSGTATVTVTGTIDLSLVGNASPTSGKTIVGTGTTATITGGLTIFGSESNIVILGVNFTNGSLNIVSAQDIHISHCTFTDTYLWVGSGADNITFSWNKFAATTTGSGSAMTISAGGPVTGIILDHNLWSDSLKTDMPAAFNARVLMFNNYFISNPGSATGNATATIAGGGAQILSLNNIYQGVNNPLTQQSGGLIRSIDNFMTATTGTTAPGDDKVFVPPYSYLMHPATAADFLTTLITAHAGNTDGGNSITPATTNATASVAASDLTDWESIAATDWAFVPLGDRFTLTANASGFIPDANPSARQWYLNNFAIPGANASTHTVSAVTAADAGYYTVTLTTPAGEIVTSGAFTMLVGERTMPFITTHPVSQTVTAGASATFAVAATGKDLSYRWQKDGAAIPGATGASYTITNAQPAHAGSYRVIVSNSLSSAISNPATLTVNTGGSGGSNPGGNSGGGGGGGAPSLWWLAAAITLLTIRPRRFNA